MKTRIRWILIVALLVTTLLAACGAPAAPTTPTTPAPTTPSPTTPAASTLPGNTVGAVKADTAPTIDGTVDAIWANAKPLPITVSGGKNLPNGSTTVELRALYTADTIYFLAQWSDPTESVRRGRIR